MSNDMKTEMDLMDILEQTNRKLEIAESIINNSFEVKESDTAKVLFSDNNEVLYGYRCEDRDKQVIYELDKTQCEYLNDLIGEKEVETRAVDEFIKWLEEVKNFDRSICSVKDDIVEIYLTDDNVYETYSEREEYGDDVILLTLSDDVVVTTLPHTTEEVRVVLREWRKFKNG